MLASTQIRLLVNVADSVLDFKFADIFSEVEMVFHHRYRRNARKNLKFPLNSQNYLDLDLN